VSDELRRRLDRIKSDYQTLDEAVCWFDEQRTKPNLDRVALDAIWARLKMKTAELKAEIADFEKALD
jgi:hypothetical protein